MHIAVDQGKCCGAGHCVLLAPEVFDQSEEDGLVVLLVAGPTGDLDGVVTEAAAVCPTGAITTSLR